jgi:hypothetical protein
LKDFMKDLGVGISLGLWFGAALAASSPALARKKVVSEKPPPHPLGLY